MWCVNSSVRNKGCAPFGWGPHILVSVHPVRAPQAAKLAAKSGRASGKFGVILVKLIDYSRKFPSGPVTNYPKFAAWHLTRHSKIIPFHVDRPVDINLRTYPAAFFLKKI